MVDTKNIANVQSNIE